MYRKVSQYLSDWRHNPNRKPMLLHGARQVGKTYSLLEFGKTQYENTAYFNFETNPLIASTFNESIDPDYLIPLLSRLSNQTIMKDKTLIILDEIQICERALTSLKYFCESAPEYHVIAAGSLLGVAVNREKYAFPVGKVDIKTMYPMDFEEFLYAHDEKELIDQIKTCFQDNRAIPEALHHIALQYYRQYLVTGGMPDCVDQIIITKNYTFIRHLQKEILTGYLNDMSKYNTRIELRKTRLVFDVITVQLSKKNTRFQYKLIKSGARASEFENSIEWLVLSGMMHRIFRVDQAFVPLENYRDIDSFKTYLSDLGLLCAKKDIYFDDVIQNNPVLNDFKGGMVENYVCCQLIANGYTPYYWHSTREAEVDFLIQQKGNIIPIEVKSSDNTKSKSLNIYMDQYQPEYAIKLSTRNFGYEKHKKIVPLYAAFCI
ncbi:MAG: ATP-binding protein [Caldisericia bacterium]|nr:ATP-binding protein [Caldisericia bacterium]